jgi:hypothetical protein
VEHHEALETSAVVRKLADAVKAQVNDLLPNCIMTASIIICCIFLARNKLLGVEQLAVGAGADLINNSGLQVQEDGTGNVLASTSLREEGVESIVLDADGLVGWHSAIRLNSVLEAEKFPAGITNLGTSLANVNTNRLAHVVDGSKLKDAKSNKVQKL